MVFVFSIVFIFVFRAPISSLIPKIRKISKDGLSAEGNTPEIQLEENNSESVQQLLDMIESTIVIAGLEDRIRADLGARGLIPSDDASKVLVRHLAGTQLLLHLEQVHHLIFGSQIILLKKLNEVAGRGRSMDYVTTHIDHVKKMYSDSLGEWSIEQYLEFLFDRNLVIQHDDQLHITDLGVEYLVWVARSGKREDNPL